MALDVLKRAHQAGRGLNELARVLAGKAGENATAPAGDTEDCAAAVGRIFPALEQVLALAAVHQLDGAVVLEAEAPGGVGDGDGGFIGRAGHLEKQLVLLGLEAGFDRGLLTEVEEAAQLKAEVRQGANEGIGNKGFRVSGHIYIVSRYKCL